MERGRTTGPAGGAQSERGAVMARTDEISYEHLQTQLNGGHFYMLDDDEVDTDPKGKAVKPEDPWAFDDEGSPI